MSCITSINVTPKTITLKVGDWYYCACAEITPSDADCTDVVWHSDDPDIASVNESNGYIFANSLGTTTIYATTTDGSECCDCMTVTVSDTIPVTMVSLNNSSLSIEEGTSNLLVATVYPLNASDSSVTWSSDNEGVAFVGEDGTVCGMSTGDTYITATSNSNPNISAHCHVTVTGDILVQSISIRLDGDEIDENNNIDIGNSFFARAIITPTDATNHCVSWSSSNPSVATVISNTGLVTTLAEGSAVITATACDGSGVSASVTITVRRIYVTGIDIEASTYTMEAGNDKCFLHWVVPYNATNKSVMWSSSNTSVATVKNGCVTAIAPGETTITVITVDGYKKAECILTVTPADTRSSVYITQSAYDSYGGKYYFNITFNNGRVWKSIEYDLGNPDASMTIPDSAYDRNLYNLDQNFTEEQLAYIYLFDPLGVEHYVKHCPFYTNKALLFFKDNVYEKIFGKKPQFFKVWPDDTITYYTNVSTDNREDYYSEAEVLFGAHSMTGAFERHVFGAKVIINIVDAALGIFSDTYSDVTSAISRGVQAYQLLFYSGSIANATSSTVSGFLDDYLTSNNLTNKFFNWVSPIAGVIVSTVQDFFDIFTPPNLGHISIYNRVNADNYKTYIMLESGAPISVKDICNKYK
ncbi:MAG: Ig domain-containing protein [Ruminococcaceae bacterium]|nr:Ig domain-containing protein [Oscillospiraceae bacterium]